MLSDDDILDSIRRDPGLGELLWDVCEFDLSRDDHGEPVRLSSGLALEGVAGDFTGGTFFLCGDRRMARPVLYASSEGQAGLIGQSLAEALEIMAGLPSWWDCLKFSGSGDLQVMRTTADHLARDELRNEPEIGAQRIRLAAALDLELASAPVLIARLHAAVSATTPDFVLTVGTGETDRAPCRGVADQGVGVRGCLPGAHFHGWVPLPEQGVGHRVTLLGERPVQP